MAPREQRARIVELEAMAGQVRRRWPGVDVELDFDTHEGEDAYIWITARPVDLDAVRVHASAVTNQIWKKHGLHVVPRMRLPEEVG